MDESIILILCAIMCSFIWAYIFIDNILYGLLILSILLFALRVVYPKLTDNFLWIIGIPLGTLLAIGLRWVL